jgi:hypothetical protein
MAIGADGAPADGDDEMTPASGAMLRGLGVFEIAGGIAGLLFLLLAWPGLNLLVVLFIALCATLIHCGVRLYRRDRRRLWLAAVVLLPGLVAIQFGGLQFQCALPVGLYFGGSFAESGVVQLGLNWTLPTFVISTEEPAGASSFQLNLIVAGALILLRRARALSA